MQKIPVIFHNLKGYNSHHIRKRLVSLVKKQTLHQGEWKNVWFLCYENTFIDSMQFTDSSLKNLVKSLPKINLINYLKI